VRIVIGASVALLIVWLVGQVLGAGAGFLWARRRSRGVFERRLRRNGLPDDVIEAFLREYEASRLIRDLVSSNGF